MKRNEGKKQHGLTKSGLILRAVRSGTGNGLVFCFLLVCFSAMLICGLIMRGLGRWIIALVILCFVGCAVIAAVFLLTSVEGVLLLRQQEKELNFTFRQDTGSVPVDEYSAVDYRWFIRWDTGRILAFRRDFIRSVHHFRKDPLYPRGYTVLVTDCRGRTHLLHGRSGALKQLKKWYNAPPADSIH